VPVEETALGFPIGKPGEPAQVAPVGAGAVAAIGPGQLLADRCGDVRRQGSGTNVHPGLQVAGTGLQYHTGFMPPGRHGREDRGLGAVQIDQNVTGVVVLEYGCT
jgi:hypothetical protein